MGSNVKIVLACLIIVLFQSVAIAASGPYVRGSIGASFVEDISGSSPYNSSFNNKFNSGQVYGGAAGYRWHNIRLEGEFVFQENDYDKIQNSSGTYVNAKGSISNQSLLLNGYYDFLNESRFTPFVGAGLGASKVEINDLLATGWSKPLNRDDTVLGYQLSAGVAAALSESYQLVVYYRYLATEDPHFDSDVDYEFSSHNIMLGLRVDF